MSLTRRRTKEFSKADERHRSEAPKAFHLSTILWPLWLAALGGLAGCDGCDPNAQRASSGDASNRSATSAPPAPEEQPPSTHRAESSSTANNDQGAYETAKRQLDSDLAENASKRAATPGAVRFALDFEAPVSGIHTTCLGGLGVSAGKFVDTVTSSGVSRWRHNVGAGHELYRIGDAQIAWAPQYHQLIELKAHGRTGWTRDWKGVVAAGDQGDLFLIDASTVSKLGPDGADLWRAVPSMIRHLEGPFVCRTGTLFHGVRGLSRLAVRVSDRGCVIRETPLERGAVMLGAAPDCTPLVWNSEEVSLVTENGGTAWSFTLLTQPYVERLHGGWALVTPRGDSPANFAVISDHGRAEGLIELPVNGRITAARVLTDPTAPSRIAGLAVCRDVTSPCARPENLRGPFDVLLVFQRAGGVTPLLRHIPGHLNVASTSFGFVVASSAAPDVTDLTFRDHDWRVIWTRAIPGRLSAGPVVGDNRDVFVATCEGWECQAPYRLFSITLLPPEQEPADNLPPPPGAGVAASHREQ